MGYSFTTITPYLHYPDGDAAVAWLTRVFGFGPARKFAGDDGLWAEGDVAVGAVRIDISGGQDPATAGGHRAAMIVSVDDVDALHEHIVAAGVGVNPPRDEAYGPRTCTVTDPWGYVWYFWQGEAVFS